MDGERQMREIVYSLPSGGMLFQCPADVSEEELADIRAVLLLQLDSMERDVAQRKQQLRWRRGHEVVGEDH